MNNVSFFQKKMKGMSDICRRRDQEVVAQTLLLVSLTYQMVNNLYLQEIIKRSFIMKIKVDHYH